MEKLRRGVPTWLLVLAGVAVGWALAGRGPRIVAAPERDDYSEEFASAVATISLQYNDRSKIQTSQDALFFIDYVGGRLLGTIPVLRQSGGKSKLIESFVERDLVADFKIAPGSTPHFRMNSVQLGIYGSGWAPMCVFETTTRQVGVYKLQEQTVGSMSIPKFELLQVISYAPKAATTPAKP